MTLKRVFITGGASGLGRALAERYARAGTRVCIADIHEERSDETLRSLRQLGATAMALRCDVRREEDLQAAAERLVAEWGGVDVVVNNAGVAACGRMDEVSVADWQWIVDINLLGVVRGCKVFIPVLRAQGGGHIVNVASMAGLVHAPSMSAYNATKAAVVAISETLRAELAADHIDVSVACPSFFRTNLAESLRAPFEDKARVTRLVTEAKQGADEVAELVYRGVERRDLHVLTDLDGRLAWWLKRVTPFAVASRVLSSIYDAAGSRDAERQKWPAYRRSRDR